MNFDEIYELAIWIDEVSRKYWQPVLKVTTLFDEISKSHTVEETKNIIIKGFVMAKGEENGKEISGNTGD